MKKFILSLFLLCFLSGYAHAAILVVQQHGIYTTKTTLENARTAADVAGKTVIVTSALTQAQSNISGAWPSDRALKFEKGGSIANSTAFTISGPFTAGVHQVFNGAGVVSFTKYPDAVYPEWWGVDGTADNVQIQAAINSLGNSTTTITGGKVVLTGNYNIAAMILIRNKSIEIEGRGYGNALNNIPTYLKWTGSAGAEMIRVQSCRGLKMKNLRLIGSKTSKPLAAISMYVVNHEGGDNDISQNSFNVFENIWIGAYDGLDAAAAVGDYEFSDGIYFHGDDTGNNYNTFKNIRVSMCNTGVNIAGVQYGQNTFDGLWASFCYIGFATTAPAIGHDWFFDNSQAFDIQVLSDARLQLYDYASEASYQMAYVRSGRLVVNGGTFSIPAVFSGTIIDGTGGDASVVTLNNFQLYNAAGYVGTPLFNFTSANDSSIKGFFGKTCRGITPAMISANTNTGNQLQQVFIDIEIIETSSNASYTIKNNLGPTAYGVAETVSETRYDMPENLKLKKSLIHKINTLANSATPSVANGSVFLTGGTTTITNFTNGTVGQIINILAEHAITITDGANIFLASSANFVMAATGSLTLIQKADGKWYELSRSVN